MTVFISCSGSLSKKVGELLVSWLPDVIQGVETWLYSEDIEKGAMWPDEVNKALATTVGILCVTQENKNAPWLLFEAGGLSKGLAEARVCPLLIDLKPQDVKQPLSRFNFTVPSKEDMWKLLTTINRSDSDKELQEPRLQKAFDRLWPEFERAFQEIIREMHKNQAKPPQRSVDDMIVEILKISRELQRNSDELLQLSKGQVPATLEGGYSGYSGYSGYGPTGSDVFNKPEQNRAALLYLSRLLLKHLKTEEEKPAAKSAE